MPTTIWKGAISFGLVTIPVSLHSAVREQGGISFNQLHGKDKSRIRYKKFCEREGKEVPADEIVKGYEYEKGKYVILSDEELEQAERATSRSFEIAAFVKEDDIDPRYFDKPYYLAPMPGGEKAYALLRETMDRTGSIGVGSFVLRKRTHLAGLKAVGDALVLELMRYERELVDVRELRIPEVKDLRPQELKMAEQLVENLSEPFDPGKFRDVYTEGLMQVIQAKIKGKKPSLPEAEEPDTDGVIDLMARLQESIKGTQKSGGAKKKAAPAKKKAAPARKSA
jgi:DNA end-binding protein Ku